jgi:hypothetical protein
MLRIIASVLFVSGTLTALGCGSDRPPSIAPSNTVPVNGSVTYRGKAAAGYKVTFHPQFDIGSIKFTPSGETDNQGKYTLSTGAPGNGAPPGKYKVTIEKLYATSDRKGQDTEADALKGKYNPKDPATSKFEVEVKSGDNTLEPFRLD